MTDLLNPAVQALLDRVTALGDGQAQTDFLLFIGARVGVLAESHARAGYPPEPNGRPLELYYDRTSTAKKPYKTASGQQRTPGGAYKSKFKSLKQQRKVLALGMAGKIPRPRTGQLGNSLTHHVTVANGGVIIAVGTNLGYAQFVIGAKDVQNHYHTLSGWVPLDQALAAHTDDYRHEIVTSGGAWLGGYLKGGSR